MFSVLSLVLGIVGLVGGIIVTTLLYSVVAGIIFIIIGVLGIIFAVIGRKKEQSGMATAGLVLSILAVIFSIIFTIACASAHSVTDPLTDPSAAEQLVNDLAAELENLGN